MKMYYIISSTHKFQSVERLNTVTDNSKKAKKICNENFLGNLFVSNTSSHKGSMQTQHEDICSKQRCILFYQAGIIERNSFCTLGSVYLQSWIVWGV